MAHRFTGSNNIALFDDIGQFGCLDPNTKVITIDGLKPIKDLHHYDQLLNEDLKPQRILKFYSGTDEMYEITQRYGSRYRVNSNHILTLKKDQQIVDIKVSDFVKLSRNQQRRYQGIRIISEHSVPNYDDLYQKGFNQIRVKKTGVN